MRCACGPRLLGYGGRMLAQPQSQVRGGAELCDAQHGVAVVVVEMRVHVTVTPPAAASVVGRIHIVACILLSLLAVL